jgi:hypothetical protein
MATKILRSFIFRRRAGVGCSHHRSSHDGWHTCSRQSRIEGWYVPLKLALTRYQKVTIKMKNTVVLITKQLLWN